jgi:uncharacterized protein YacL
MSKIFAKACQLFNIYAIIFSMNVLVFIGILLLFPIYVFSELSFYLLPITVLGALGIYGYSLARKEYHKYVKQLEVFFFLIISGVANYFIEALLKVTSYFNPEDLVFLRHVVIFGIVLCLLIAYLAEKKDIRYFSIPVITIILVIIYKLYYFVTQLG